jgi:broad specificity phosphatase PhoE
MFRDFADMHIGRPNLNVIIVTHGLTLRLVSFRLVSMSPLATVCTQLVKWHGP